MIAVEQHHRTHIRVDTTPHRHQTTETEAISQAQTHTQTRRPPT